jgi:hypothetical protein
LDVAQWDAGVQGGRDEGMARGVRSHALADPGMARDATHDPRRTVTVEAQPVTPDEDRTFAAFTEDKIDGAGGARRERHGDGLAALTHDDQGAVAALESQAFDVGTDRFRDSQPVQRQQRDQRVVTGASQSGGDEDRSDFVAVQARGVGLVIEPRPAYVHRRRAVEQSFLDGVAVQGGDRAQPTRDRRPRPTCILKVTGEALDVVAGNIEQRQMALLAPRRELAQVQGVGVARQPRVAAQEADQRLLLQGAEHAIRSTLHRQS